MSLIAIFPLFSMTHAISDTCNADPNWHFLSQGSQPRKISNSEILRK